MKLSFVVLVILSVVGTQAANFCTFPATYNVDVACEWTAQRHPNKYPADNPPHFTVMCGTAHNSDYTLWTVGGIASPGLEQAAELGFCSILEDEIKNCMDDANCAPGSYFEWDSTPPFENVCVFSGQMTVTPKYQYVSMVSMIVPSPDWAVGLDGIHLCQLNGNGDFVWIDRYPSFGREDIYAFDAGTDLGTSFFSPNVDAKPFIPITLFDKANPSNIFYNQREGKLYPMCTARIVRA